MWHTYQSKSPDNTGKIPWTPEEDATWQKLISRQMKTIEHRACQEFIDGLSRIDFPREHIPDHLALNTRLSSYTWWWVEPVAALISDREFHTLLSHRRFPAASFIRIPEELDYLEEPDIFHEFFGHIPLLTDQRYADFVEKFGRFTLSVRPGLRKYLSRIFWFTIEFWLIQTDEWLRIFGAGILSSHGETIRALEDPSVERMPFDPLTCARTPYRYDIMQSRYFFIRDFDELFSLFDTDLLALLEQADILGDIIH